MGHGGTSTGEIMGIEGFQSRGWAYTPTAGKKGQKCWAGVVWYTEVLQEYRKKNHSVEMSRSGNTWGCNRGGS